MGLEIKVIDNTVDGNKRAQLLCESDNNFTSVIQVQAHQRINVGIVVGSQVSDILSAAGLSAASFATPASIFSGTVTLQRRMPEETEDYQWRDVAEWAISSAAINEGGSENVTVSPEPETAQFRAGIKTTKFTGGDAIVRIGTT